MKKIIVLLSISFGLICNAQVGINQASPSATLDVVTKPTDTKALEVNDDSAKELLTVLKNGQVGINVASPDQSAKLQINSTTQGFLPPKMTTLQRDAIVTPIDGLVVYNTDDKCLNQRRNTEWQSLCTPGSYFHIRKSTSTNYNGAGSLIKKLVLDVTPAVNTGSVFSFNSANNTLTVSRAGLYQFTFQTSFTNIDGGDQILLGIVNSTGNWIGRGNKFASKNLRDFVGEITTYSTVLNMTAGQTIYFGVASSPGTNFTILGNETGDSGTGNVTNITIIALQ